MSSPKTLVVLFDVEGGTREEQERLLRVVTDAAIGGCGFQRFELRDEKIFDAVLEGRGDER